MPVYTVIPIPTDEQLQKHPNTIWLKNKGNAYFMRINEDLVMLKNDKYMRDDQIAINGYYRKLLGVEINDKIKIEEH